MALNRALLQSAWLQPVKCMWRTVRRFPLVRRYIEPIILYPRLPHIARHESYPPGPMLIAGFFSSAHGIGEAARLELAAQRAQDKNVLGVDIAPAFGLCEMDVPDGVVPLDQAPAHGPLLLHCNAPEAGRALQFLGCKLTSERHIIGYWAWELEVPPYDWARAYPYLDELWVPSTFTAKAFAAAPFTVKVHPHRIMPIPDGGHSLTELGLAQCEGKTVFLCMADARSDLVRKNIAGTVRAFGAACGDLSNAALIVKLHHTEFAGSELSRVHNLCEKYANIHLVESCFTSAQRDSLLCRVDGVISLHRAEGYGLLLAEAKSLGKKIIATAYSAPSEFLNATTDNLIPYFLVSVHGGTVNYGEYPHAVWAEPDENAAVEAIRFVLKQCQKK